MRDTLLILLSIPIMLFTYKEALQLIPYTVEGIVVGPDDKPVGQAHVYTVRGEEETFTDNAGRFRLSTWQKLPVILTIDHNSYELRKIKVLNYTDQTTIKLTRKLPK